MIFLFPFGYKDVLSYTNLHIEWLDSRGSMSGLSSDLYVDNNVLLKLIIFCGWDRNEAREKYYNGVRSHYQRF
jgi:hypothetical protein